MNGKLSWLTFLQCDGDVSLWHRTALKNLKLAGGTQLQRGHGAIAMGPISYGLYIVQRQNS